MMHPHIIPWLLSLLHLITTSDSLIAYDCADSKINITTISIQGVGECIQKQERVITEELYGQLLQSSDETLVHVYTCKVTITRHVYHCGMHSHLSAVSGGYASYIDKQGRSRCRDIHFHRQYTTPYGKVIQGLSSNSSVTVPILLGGDIDASGTCIGGSFTDPYGSWNGVIIQGQVQILLSDQYITANLKTDTIFLSSGQRCIYGSLYCIDHEIGETVWEADVDPTCGKLEHVIIYQGPIRRHQTVSGKTNGTSIYTIESDGRLISLRENGKYTQCPWTMISTEHPRLYIHIPQSPQHTLPLKPANPHDIDMMLYVNSKFVYLDRTIGKTITEMYYELEYRRCTAERQSLATLLSLAIINPVEFAYAYTNQAGYTAALMGETVHIAQCLPVEVSLRKTDRCYQEMPVLFRNESWFMAPRTRLLQKHATEIGCDPLLSPMYRIRDTWYSLSPDLRLSKPPLELSPMQPSTWEYMNPSSLMTDGLYTMQDLEKMRMQLLHPAEKAAIENIIVQGSLGTNVNLQNVDITRIFTEKGMEAVTESIAHRLWGWFSTVGKISSGLVGIYVIWLCLKFIIDTLIHGRILYAIFGKSLYLMGALWSSITAYLIASRVHSHAPNKDSEQNIEEGTQLNPQPGQQHPLPSAPTVDRVTMSATPTIYPALHKHVPYS